MAARRWQLDELTPRWGLSDSGIDLGPGFEDCSVQSIRLQGGHSEGVHVVRLTTPRMEIDVIPTRGLGIRRARVDGLDLAWVSPVRGPVHPMWVNLAEPDGLGWLTGFDEFLVRCGLASNGAPEFTRSGELIYPLHGRIANLPAHTVMLEARPEVGELVLTGQVDESRFAGLNVSLHAQVVVSRDEPTFVIRDEVVNRSAAASKVQLLYHINIGRPLLGAGTTLIAPVSEVLPRDDASAKSVRSWHRCEVDSQSPELAYYLRLRSDADGRTAVLLRSPGGTTGASVHFRTSELPCFTFWKRCGHEADGYVVGLEPGTNYPNRHSFEESRGRVVTLAGGESTAFELTVVAHAEPRSVAAVEQWITGLASGTPRIHKDPDPTFCETTHQS